MEMDDTQALEEAPPLATATDNDNNDELLGDTQRSATERGDDDDDGAAEEDQEEASAMDDNGGDDNDHDVHDDDDDDGQGTEISTDRIDTGALESLFTERSDDGTEDGAAEQTDDMEVAQVCPTKDDDDADDEENEQTQSEERGLPETAPDMEATTTDQASNGPQERNDTILESKVDPSVESPTIASPVVEQPVPVKRSPSRPTIPARPTRPVAALPVPTLSTPVLPATHSHRHVNGSTATVPALQLISFDVGGKLFKCKASLIRKYPAKRLCHVISCGCEQIDASTFFIDRNPQHFEIILDWYRTGQRLSALPTHVNEDALKEDAKYFDVLDELFSSEALATTAAAPRIPPRATNAPSSDVAPPPSVLPRLSERVAARPQPQPPAPSSSSVPLLITQPPVPDRKPPPPRPENVHPPRPLVSPFSDDPVRFSTRETRNVRGTADGGVAPVWFAVRRHEHLVVESVKGSGRLVVRVTDFSGMAEVFVDHAVLFDSRSWFYRQDDGRAKLQHCVLPGNHVYSFWMEPYATEPQQPASSAKPKQFPTQQDANKTTGKKPAKAATAAAASVAVVNDPAKHELEVEFRLIATFSFGEKILDDDESDLLELLQAKGNGWGSDAVSGTGGGVGSSSPSAGAPVCLFLPPREDRSCLMNPSKIEQPALEQLSQRDAIADQIRAQAERDRVQKQAATSTNTTVNSSSSGGGTALKRSGAAVVQASPPQQQQQRNRGGEKVTIHQPINVVGSPRSPGSKKYVGQQPRHF